MFFHLGKKFLLALLILFFALPVIFAQNLSGESDSPQENEISEDSAKSSDSSETDKSSDSKSTPKEPKLDFQDWNIKAFSKVLFATPILFFKNILDDKYPIRVDFGAEPHRHGSMVFGAIDYDWSSTFSQRIRLEYDHYTTSEKTPNALSAEEVRAISITTYPLVFFFGDSNISAQSRFSQLDIGLYYSYSKTNTTTSGFFNFPEDEEWGDFSGLRGFLTNDESQKYHLVGPAFGHSVNFPLFRNYISATVEGFFVPAFFIKLDTASNANYYLEDGVVPSDSSLSYRSLSFPLVQQTVSLDLFRYLRLKAQATYQHLDLRAIKDIEGIQNYSLHTFTLRYGGEILNPAKTRKKSAHLWAGLYYEMTWNKINFSDYSLKSHDGKWVLCFAK